MSSFLPTSSSAAMNSHTGTLQRSPVNNAVAADALRKKMQQLRDELERVKDDLDRARKEYEKERHAREVVSWISTFVPTIRFDLFRPKEKLVNWHENFTRTKSNWNELRND